MVDGNLGLSQDWADHRHLHCCPQQHWLVLPRCVEETEVLNVHHVLDQQVEEEDGADEGEGEGEDWKKGSLLGSYTPRAVGPANFHVIKPMIS